MFKKIQTKEIQFLA